MVLEHINALISRWRGSFILLRAAGPQGTIFLATMRIRRHGLRPNFLAYVDTASLDPC